MRRVGRRHQSDYLEEEFSENFAEIDETEEYEENDIELADSSEEDVRPSIWVKIGKIALIILVLIALFFISMKVTEIFLDRNQEPDTYGADAPAYSEEIEEENNEFIPEVAEPYVEETLEEPPQEAEETKTEKTKKEETEKEKTENPPTTETKEPVKEEPPTEAPSETPSTPAPSTPSKPVITPGNPAA